MFIGHYGVSFAAKPLGPRVPLWVLVHRRAMAGCRLVDPRAAGHRKDAHRARLHRSQLYELYYMPYTHGLPGSIVLSLIFAGIVAWFVSDNRGNIFLLVAAAVFSH